MHLHNHSSYSVIDGHGQIDTYLKLAVKDNQKFFALTDHGNLGGAIEFYTSAKKYGVKPIIGMELYVDAYELREKNYPGHLTVLAKNEAGYRALIGINNLAQRQFYYRPRVTLQQIIEGNFAENWIILSGCMSSPINNLPFAEAEIIVRQLASKAAGFFLEVMWHTTSDEQFYVKQNMYMERVAALYKATGLPVVITNDCHYAEKHEEDVHRAFLESTHADAGLEFDGTGFHFKTTSEMQSIANRMGIPNAVANAVDIGNICNIVIPEADHINWYVPDITDGKAEETINSICEPKLIAMLHFHHNAMEYTHRYDYEMAVLKTSPAILNSYLVTYDLVEWCNRNGIPAAARGSMAGSLVSHLLGITKEDPVKYNLSFSRAVNPARPTIPDFDLDVSSIRRQEILDYLKQRYAGNIPIAAYSHYGPKGALRKILKMEGLRDQANINQLCGALPDDWPSAAKMVWDPDLSHYNYPEGLQDENDGKKIVEVGGSDRKHHASNRYAPEWLKSIPENYWDPLVNYEGVYATMSVHPSGVLISGPERQLEHEVPLQWIASSSMNVSAFDMYTLKKMGLFKLDVLGLRTLDQLSFMERVSGAKLPDDNYDDLDILAAFGAGKLSEIFQMDGHSCRSVIESIRPITAFEDIIAANTLARPGCSQFTPFYRSGYEGLLREYPILSDVLGPTNGLILYQEQVMEIARLLADFDDTEQDDVKESIKYFNHKNWEENIVPKFSQRCAVKGVDATHILEAIAKMASYTYNRAHAMTYAAIAYKMMWYKIYYPAAFYAAVFDDSDDKARLVLESHFFNVKWQPADINLSESHTTVKDNVILLGLSAIKGVGPAAYEAITKARPFVSIEDLESRVERRKCNIRVIESLKAGYACTSIGIPGVFSAFQEAFGFSYSFLDADNSRQLTIWTDEQPAFRFGGYITNMRVFKVGSAGQNHGKEMCQLTVVNANGGKKAVIFPDVWKKASGKLYTGAAVKLLGSSQASGDFIVESGA